MVVLAENGEEAIAPALELVPDVVVLEVRMPRTQAERRGA